MQLGGTFSLGAVERIFKETNRDKAKAELFQRVLDINKRLGVNIKVSSESPKKLLVRLIHIEILICILTV